MLSAQHTLSASSRDFKLSKQLPHVKRDLPAKQLLCVERAWGANIRLKLLFQSLISISKKQKPPKQYKTNSSDIYYTKTQRIPKFQRFTQKEVIKEEKIDNSYVLITEYAYAHQLSILPIVLENLTDFPFILLILSIMLLLS